MKVCECVCLCMLLRNAVGWGSSTGWPLGWRFHLLLLFMAQAVSWAYETSSGHVMLLTSLVSRWQLTVRIKTFPGRTLRESPTPSPGFCLHTVPRDRKAKPRTMNWTVKEPTVTVQPPLSSVLSNLPNSTPRTCLRITILSENFTEAVITWTSKRK